MLSRNISRIGVIAIISAFVLGSASARKSDPNAVGGGGNGAPPIAAPPAPQAMPPEYAYGFWESSFGAVRIDRDTRVAMPESVTGTWTYNRGGQYVTGYFAGTLRGTVLEFSWTEPLQPPLSGTGFIAFDTAGTSFSGSWATNNRDRSGTWTGWRGQGQAAPTAPSTPTTPQDPPTIPLPPPTNPSVQPEPPTYYPDPVAPSPTSPQPEPPTYYPYPAQPTTPPYAPAPTPPTYYPAPAPQAPPPPNGAPGANQ